MSEFKPPIGEVFKRFEVVGRDPDGWVTVSTPTLDRMNDRVVSTGLQVDAYRKNPVLLWGHNYNDPYAVIGRATAVEVTDSGMRLLPEWREPTNDTDPMHIIASLWDTKFVNAFSIGFRPIRYEENAEGGLDYLESEILEVSLVPVPANAEALRTAVKYLGGETRTLDDLVPPVEPVEPKALAWVRVLSVETNTGQHTALACFNPWTREIPEDAVQLTCDDEGELTEVPHPDAGTMIHGLDCTYVPPIPFWSEKWGDDAVYATTGRAVLDDELVKSPAWEVLDLSDVVYQLDQAPEAGDVTQRTLGLEVCTITKRGITAARELVRRRVGLENNTTKERGEEELDAPDPTPAEVEVWRAFSEFFSVALGEIAQQVTPQGDVQDE